MKFQCQVPFGHIKFLSLMQITSNVVSKYKGIFQCCFLMISMTSYRNTYDISEADWKSHEREQNYVKYPLIIECNVVVWVIWLGKEWRKLTQKPNENTENPIPSSAYVQKTSYTFLCKRSATWILSVHGTQWSETLNLTCQFSYKHSLLSHVMKYLVYAHRHTHNCNAEVAQHYRSLLWDNHCSVFQFLGVHSVTHPVDVSVCCPVKVFWKRCRVAEERVGCDE